MIGPKLVRGVPLMWGCVFFVFQHHPAVDDNLGKLGVSGKPLRWCEFRGYG